MQFEADLIKLLQHGSNIFGNAVFSAITQLGTESLFLIVAVVLYWCVDKPYAYRFFNVYILGVALNNFLKLGIKRPRPFDAHGEISSIGPPEKSFSFPSGHTESIASVSTMMSLKYRKAHKAVLPVCIVATALVMLSRMYLGQHYLTDVLAGLVIGVANVFAFNGLLELFGDKEDRFVLPGIVLAAIILIVLAATGSIDSASGGDTLKGLGAFLAFDIGYCFEKRFVRFDVERNRSPFTIALRLVIGLGVTVGIQQGFKLFLPENIPMLYCFARYFIMAAWVAVAAPFVFKCVEPRLARVLPCRARAFALGESLIIKTPELMEKLGASLSQTLKGGDVVLLSGELGAGKTVLCKGIAKGLGVTASVTSPTFTLMNEYFGTVKLCHFDAYRLDGEDEAYAAGLCDFIGNADCVCVIEWWQNIKSLFTNMHAIKIDIKKLNDGSREVNSEAYE